MRIRDKTSAIGQDFKIGGERKRNITTQHVAANMIEDLIRILVCSEDEDILLFSISMSKNNEGPPWHFQHPSANTGRMVLGAYDRYVPEPKVNSKSR